MNLTLSEYWQLGSRAGVGVAAGVGEGKLVGVGKICVGVAVGVMAVGGGVGVCMTVGAWQAVIRNASNTTDKAVFRMGEVYHEAQDSFILTGNWE